MKVRVTENGYQRTVAHGLNKAAAEAEADHQAARCFGHGWQACRRVEGRTRFAAHGILISITPEHG